MMLKIGLRRRNSSEMLGIFIQFFPANIDFAYPLLSLAQARIW